MSEAGAVGTAASVWVVAATEGEVTGETGCGRTACCCGCGLAGLGSVAMRADAPLRGAGTALRNCLADAVFIFTGAGALSAAADTGVLTSAARKLLGSAVAAFAAFAAWADC